MQYAPGARDKPVKVILLVHVRSNYIAALINSEHVGVERVRNVDVDIGAGAVAEKSMEGKSVNEDGLWIITPHADDVARVVHVPRLGQIAARHVEVRTFAVVDDIGAVPEVLVVIKHTGVTVRPNVYLLNSGRNLKSK